MYYTYAAPNQTFGDIYVTTRASKFFLFPTGNSVPNINNSATDEEDVFATENGLVLYFGSSRASGTNLDLFVAVRQSNGLFSTPQPLTNLNTNTYVETKPRLTRDGLRIYWSSTRTDGGALGGTDIWTATRSSTAETFGTPTRVPELSSAANEGPSWISPDGCIIYFQSDRSGGLGAQDIYVAVKPMP
jgi:hypothetical protein